MVKEPRYRLQVVGPDDQLVTSWPAGHTLEVEITDAIVSAALARGVGVFRTESQVVVAIRAAVASVFRGIKQQVRPR